MDPEQDRLTRQTLLDRLESESMLFAASHFPHPSFGAIRRGHGRRYWEPILEFEVRAGRWPRDRRRRGRRDDGTRQHRLGCG
jgi:hypothetical protein